MQGAEVKVGEGLLLLGREPAGRGGRRQDGLKAREVAVKVADVRRRLQGRQEGRRHLLGQEGVPVHLLEVIERGLVTPRCSLHARPLVGDIGLAYVLRVGMVLFLFGIALACLSL